MKHKLVNENFRENYGENLLKHRGVEDVTLFMNPTPDCLQDPIFLDNIEEGAKLLLNTIKEDDGEILIIVDSDTDGFTSAAIIHQYIRDISPCTKIDYWLHEGKQHGLEDHIDLLLETGDKYSLVILPDSSSNDYHYHNELWKIGVPVLVLDHHEVDAPISENAIVINNQSSPNYENKELAGAGVVYQFCRYLDRVLDVEFAKQYIDLAALGIVADMSLVITMENRYIIHKGFLNVKNFLFRSILDKQSYSTGGKINPMTIAFYVSPLINAMIRVGSMEEKIRLYEAFVDGKKKIPSGKRGAQGTLEYAGIESARECTNARARQNKILDDAVGQLEAKVFKHGLLENEVLLVRLDDEDDFPAVLNGLTAMKLAAKFKKPTIVARLNDKGYIRGSARAVNDSPLPNLKTFFSDSGYFEYAQGHEGAHGISIENKKLDDFHEWANDKLSEVDFGEGSYNVNFIRSAMDKDLRDLVYDLVKYDDTYGQGNPEALIYVHDINIRREDVQIIGRNEDTVKFEKFGIVYIQFRAKKLIEDLMEYEESKISVVGRANINEWQGATTPQIFISAYQVEDNRLGF